MIPNREQLVGLGYQATVLWELYGLEELVDGVESFAEGGPPNWGATRPDFMVHLFGGAKVLVDAKCDVSGRGTVFVLNRHLKGYRGWLEESGADGLLIAAGTPEGEAHHAVDHSRVDWQYSVPCGHGSGTPGWACTYTNEPLLGAALKEFAR